MSSPVSAAQVFRLSPPQRRVWALAGAGDSGPWRALAQVRLDGPLDARALEAALAEVAARHEILRTTFPVPEGMSVPGQAVHDEPAPLRLTVREGVPAEVLWEELAARPFHPDREPPLAASLARLGPESHVLVLALHALCADEASLGVLVRDLRRAYAGRLDGEEPPVQYADVAAALDEMLESEESEAGRAWWREILPAAPSLESLPFEREAGPAPFEPRWIEAPLDVEAASPAAFLAAWQVLLARLTSGAVQVTGYELAGRHYEGFETAVGPFARAVPIRAAVRPGERFADLVARLDEEITVIQDWQDYFSWDRDDAFFPTVFRYLAEEESVGEATGVRFRLERSWACTDRFRLRLTVRGGVAELAYDAARFRERDARTLLASWLALLASATANPSLAVADLELVGPEDCRLLAEWNATERPFEPVPVHELFFAQAGRTPDAVAVSSVAGEALTYQELARRVEGLAGVLRSAGVGPDVPVALYVEASVEMVVGVLAILTAGGAYVPLDPSYPPARLALVLEGSGAPVVLTRRAWADRLPGQTAARVVAVEDWAVAPSPAQRGRVGEGAPETAAYILFTSGSTGTPKGVVVRHRALTNHMLWMQDAHPLAPGDRVLQKTPLGFDASVWELFAPLLAGAQLVVAEPETYRDPARLARVLAESGGTVLQVVPSLLRLLLGEEAFAGCTSLRRLFCGGEPLSAGLGDRVHALLPGVDLINLYGPTETTVQVVTWTAPSPTLPRFAGEGAPAPGGSESVSAVPGESVPIGRPIHNARIYLLDAGMRLVPPGLPGELYIGGEPPARGYLGRPDLTAAGFLPDPFSAEPGARLYRSGDLARYRDDGALVFLGRAGRDVKIRGYRFDPGEIEDLLGREPGVREAAVVVREDALVAYVAPGAADLAALRARLAEHLPSFLVPSAFVPLPALPRTPSGKLDRAALPDPAEAAAAPVEAGFAAPRTAAEQVLAEIWADLLGRERVGVHDDFFELGGHSLLGAQLVARVRQALGVELSLRTVFETPTVAGLASQVSAAWDVPVAPPIERVSRDGDIPLSFAQQRLWFLDRLAPGHPAYNGFTAARFAGRLDERALLAALREIVRVQESLRTTFPAVDGHPVQRPLPQIAFDLPVADLSALPQASRFPEALRLAREEARRPFDLAAGPLLRLTLLRLSDQESVLCTALHHIVSDAWSIGILYRDLMALYAAAAAGRPVSLPEPPVQYADYAVWQRRWFAEVREREVAWWRERLADLPTLRLPADRPRPTGTDAEPSPRGINLPAALPADLSDRLRRLARAESVTPFMLLLAAFQALLARWSGQDEVVVGVPVANRERAEIEGLVGFFVNTLVLPVSCAGDPTGRELLGRVREMALGAFAHQAVPFEILVEELAPERDGLQPLFQVMFQLQTVPVPRFVLPGATVEVLDVDPGAAPFDLVLDLRETPEGMPEGILGVLQANLDLFDPTTLVRLLGHYQALLEGLAADPAGRVAELPLLSPAERHQIAVEWNDTELPYERDRCVHELVAAQAAATPDAEALCFSADGADGRLTYAELEARSNRLARHLARRGAGPEAKVALRMESSAGFFVALLAILKTGAAYMPLDPTWPDSRVDLLLEQAGAVLVLTPRDLEAEDIARQSPDPLPPLAFPESLAYVVFTSGSTGRPKGVAVSHRAVVRMARSAEAMPIAADDRVAQVSNVSFDGLVYEIWGALINGACLVGLPREVLLDLRALADYLRRERISFFLAPAALLHQVAREEPTVFQTVRQVSSGGEAFDARAARELVRAQGMGTLLNDYGPTETTCFLLVEKVTRVADEARVVPLGRPIGNTLAAVLDPALAPVPIGAPGELCLGGEGLARGYLGQPALTAERFVPDPIGPGATGIPGTRLYRTGDRVRLLADGRLDFLGRFDDQVKVRGFRIEPGEIEGALAAHPAVAAAVVLPREEEQGSRALVAYVVPSAGAPEDLDAAGIAALRAHLRQRLPEFLVPAFFVALPALPVNRNGKVDRKALIRLAPAGPATGGSRPPRGTLEETIAAVWAETLGVSEVGAEDRFFDLGGHSLLALRVLARMRGVLRLEVPLRVLFESPTVEGIAAWIAAERGQATAAPVVPVPRDRPLPLSFTQERLWLVDRLYPGTPLYNVPAVLRLRGPLAPPALAAALAEIVRRHEVLRTRYASEEDGTPVQIVEPAGEIALPLADLSALPGERRLAEAGRLAWEESVRPFDLQAAPVLRALLLRLGEDDHVAALTTHHIASDGWSQGLFSREVGELYEAFAAGRPSPLTPLPVQYADFAVWQREHLRDDLLTHQLAWWRERLADAPPVLELPADRPRPRLQSFAGEVRATTWAPPLLESLRGLARREGGTVFLVLLAAFEALVIRLTGRADVIVGAPFANRPRPELEGLIGFFANTLVLRTDLSGDPSFREAVARVRETSLGAWEHQDLPFERLVEELRPQRDPSHPPVFQVMFIHHGEVTAAQSGLGNPRIPGLEAEPFGDRRAVSRYDLEVYALEGAEGLFLAFQYSTALFDGGRMERLLGQMETLLRGALEDPGRRLSDLPLLGEEETREILADWASGPVADQDLLLHQLFEEQTAKTPDAVALIARERSWTYRELDGRAEEIAADLWRRGVGAEDRVAISLPRTPEMIAAMLGVLKAGAAYVPIDPALPAARRARILEDAGAGWVIDSEWAPSPTLPRSAGEGAPAPSALSAVSGRVEGALSRASARGRVGEGASLAYLIYTSGSTGTPKGVAIQHSSAVAFVRWAGTVFSQSDLSGVLAATSTGFDVSVFEIFVPLAHGGTLILAENVLELPRLPAAGAVTLVCAVPTAMAELLRSGGLPGGVRVVNLGGEAVARDLADRVLAQPGVERVYNCYGPTEDTTYSTVSKLTRGEPPSIGRPIRGGKAVVVDRWLQAAPVGVPGELCLAGAGLARGYFGRPAETAEKWIPEPFSGLPGERMYRTGDLVRRRADGELEYLGRIDHQVKVRGIRIEPGEIEAVLRTFPGVADAAVGVRGDGGERRLVAWLAGPDGLDLSALRRFLRERLPEPLVPSFFAVLPDFPRTATGKVDRAALPAPATAPVEEGRTEIGGPVQDLVAGVWAEILGVERVGLHDNFFDLGGHSLLATRLVARLRALLGVELPVRTLFEAPTVAAFTRVLLAAEQGAAPPLARLARGARRGDPPLSFAQERMWFLERLAPGTYHIPLVFRLTGALDPALLEAALRALAERHEALRTTFHEVPGAGPVQRIGPAANLPLPQVDLSGLPAALREEEQERLAAGFEQAPFDLESGPLLRAVLIRLDAAAPGEHALLMTVHHIVSDGWSVGVMLRDLAVLYQALREGVPAGLPELPIQYADWAVWQREWLESGALATGLAWWREHLGGPPERLRLPGDRPRPAAPSFRSGDRREVLPPALMDPVRALARRGGASLFMVLLAAWEVFLARHAGQEDFGIGVPVAGRDRDEVEGLVGLFVNTLALRARVRGEESFAALLDRVRESTLGAFAHAWVPFERVVDAVQPRRDLAPGHSPLFQTMFVLQNLPQPAVSLPDLALSGVDPGTRTSAYDLTLVAAPDPFSDSALLVSWIWARDLFDAPTAARFAVRFRGLLAAAAADPERPVDELPLLTEPERQALLHEWNDSAAPLSGETVHRLFAAQAERRPDALAVESEGEFLTYADLDAQARRLAWRLRGLGVGPDAPVGLCADSAADLAVGMLATLQAGGACLPLDPEYPLDRLDFLLRDARPRAVLTRKHLARRLPETGVPVLLLDESLVDADTDRDPGPLPSAAVLGDHLAAVFYTSGSTGRPKGAGIPHRAVCRMVLDPRWPIGPGDRVAQLSSPSFDASTLEIWGALLRGSCLVGLRRAEILAPRALAAAIGAYSLTTLVMPAAWFHRVAAEAPDAFAPLTFLSIGGEAADPAAVARVLAAGPPQQLVHGYGPTEVTTLTTAHTVREVAAGQPILPAGRPLAGVGVHVLDRNLRPVPLGVHGELYAGGDRLARGYLRQPGLTAERFLPDPFGPPGRRLYATGDQARVLPGGEIEILGRRDRQVKVRGYRIELGEIEAVLAEHPGVAQAAVVVRDAAGEKQLAAFVVPRGEADAAELRAFLAERLPAFMMPAELLLRRNLPLTANGKVDRDALARLPLEAPEETGDAAPLTLTEELLAGLWSGVLGGRRPQPHDGFFDIGGHSLLATRLLAQIRDVFGLDLPLVAVFEAPTLALMAAKIDELARAGTPAHTAADTSWSPLVRLAAGPEGAAPLLCVHGAAGTIAVFAELARLLRDERPVYALQSRGLIEGQEPPAGIVETAELYLAALREALPHGPYRLLGYSMGSQIAYEMACRLAAAGETVELLVLVDFPAVASGLPVLEPPPLPEIIDTRGLDAATVRRYRAVWMANHNAAYFWRATPYAGRTLLIRAAEAPGPQPADPALGWNAVVAGGVDIAALPGDHFTLFSLPFVNAVAEALRDPVHSEET